MTWHRNRSDQPVPTAADEAVISRRFSLPLLLGVSLNPINTSLLATALLPIANALGVTVGQAAVLVSALYIASAIAQPTAGRLGQELGPRRVFSAGLLLVLLGGILGGIGQNLTTLTVARVLIGVGTASAYPSAMLLIRGRAESAGLTDPPGGILGGLQIAGTVTAALALPIGGLLVGTLGWRTTFLINVPAATLTLLALRCWVPADPPFRHGLTLRNLMARFDLIGIAGFAGCTASLIVFMQSFPDPEWPALVAALAFAAALVAWERSVRKPFLEVRVLASNLPLSLTFARFALTSLCIYTVLYGVTQWLEAVHGFSPLHAGLFSLPMSIVSAIVAYAVAKRNLVRGPLIVSAVACLLGSLATLALATGTSPLAALAVSAFFGVAFGTAVIANQTVIYTQSTAHDLGTASGLFRTSGYLGSAAAGALLGVAFRSGTSDSGLHAAAAAMVVASALTLIATLAGRKWAPISGDRLGRTSSGSA